MSPQQPSARDIFQRRKNFLKNFISKTHEQQPLRAYKHAVIKPMLKLAKAPLAGPPTPTTKILHDAHDGKPIITLTSYTTGFPSTADSTAVSKTPARVEWLIEPREEWPVLKRELDEYFQGLKSEFEEKTGKAWIPLRGWAREEWEWGNEVDDEAVVRGWGIV
jgi:hypothetical protein